MVLQIALGIVLAYIILSVCAAILWGVWSSIRSEAHTRAQEERKRKRESGWRAWRQDNPPQLVAVFSG